MSVTMRQVKNKHTADEGSTAYAGMSYDIFIRYNISDAYKAYGKRRFLTKKRLVGADIFVRVIISPKNY